jgi:hypothetical protein
MAINFLNSVDFNKNELLNPTIENQPNDTAAGTGVEGQLYFNTTDDILKVYTGGSWVEVGGGVISLTVNDGAYVNLTDSGTAADPNLTADLSAVDGTAASGERYLTKTNKWATVASIPGTYTFDVAADTGTPETINSGDTLDIAGGSYIATAVSATDTVTINHDPTSRTDTTSADNPVFGGTFEAVQSVTTNPTGHVTSIDVSTITLQTPEFFVDADSGTPQNIEFSETLTISGGTNISTVVGATDTVEVNLDDSITLAGTLTVAGTGQSSFSGQVTIPQTPSADTDAASKHYVDQAVTGALSYQGGYDASTNTPNLDNNPSPNPIKTGWTYTVTADGLFFTEQVRVGDVLIAESDAPTTLAEWTTVQNNVDLADLTTVGIGNVNPGEAIDVSYSNGTATVSVEDSTATNKGAVIVAPGVGMSVAYSNGTATVTNTQTNSANTYAVTITDTATVTHNLGTKDVIIQLYDVTTDETVYADVERAGQNTATITFASTPTNSIRVLVQKIG